MWTEYMHEEQNQHEYQRQKQTHLFLYIIRSLYKLYKQEKKMFTIRC